MEKESMTPRRGKGEVAQAVERLMAEAVGRQPTKDVDKALRTKWFKSLVDMVKEIKRNRDEETARLVANEMLHFSAEIHPELIIDWDELSNACGFKDGLRGEPHDAGKGSGAKAREMEPVGAAAESSGGGEIQAAVAELLDRRTLKQTLPEYRQAVERLEQGGQHDAPGEEGAVAAYALQIAYALKNAEWPPDQAEEAAELSARAMAVANKAESSGGGEIQAAVAELLGEAKPDVRIFDNGGKSFDRYTIIIGQDVYGMSENATSPQGFNQYLGLVDEFEFPLEGVKEVTLDSLPDEVRRAIDNRRKEEGESTCKPTSEIQAAVAELLGEEVLPKSLKQMLAGNVSYETKCWGQRYAVSADWAQASSPVYVRYEDEDWVPDPRGRQVADFQHRPEQALGAWILDGEDVDDPEIMKAAKDAVAKAKKVEVDADDYDDHRDDY